MNDQEVMTLCDHIRVTSMAIHAYLKHGHLEKIYENALAHRLKDKGLSWRNSILGKYLMRMEHCWATL